MEWQSSEEFQSEEQNIIESDVFELSLNPNDKRWIDDYKNIV